MPPETPRGSLLRLSQNFSLPLKLVPISVTIFRLETAPLCLQNLHGVSFQHKLFCSDFCGVAPSHENSWLYGPG